MASLTPQRFEPTMHHDREGYWSTTSSIDWCERNYQLSFYVAEFFNCFSSFQMALLGLYHLVEAIRFRHELHIVALAFASVTVGIGSALFHGTLTFIGQLGDELPMLWDMTVWLYILFHLENLEPRGWSMVIVIFLATAAISVIHAMYAFVITFQVFFMILVLTGFAYLVYYSRKFPDPNVWLLGKVSFFFFKTDLVDLFPSRPTQ